MASGFINIPAYGSESWKSPVATAADLPTNGNQIGDARVTQNTEAIYVWSGSAWILSSGGGGGGGTVTSVALTAPSIFSVTGSPITVSGTLALALVSELANTVFAAPDSSPGLPTFRGLVPNDIPSLLSSKISDFQNAVSSNTDVAANTAVRHSPVTLGTANGLSLAGQALSLALSSSSTVGALSSADWTTFNGKLTPNAPITPGTNLKITYDANGLVTAGTTAALNDLSDVSIGVPALGDIFTFGGTKWTNSPAGSASAGPGVQLFLNDTATTGGLNGLLNFPNTAIPTQTARCQV